MRLSVHPSAVAISAAVTPYVYPLGLLLLVLVFAPEDVGWEDVEGADVLLVLWLCSVVVVVEPPSDESEQAASSEVASAAVASAARVRTAIMWVPHVSQIRHREAIDAMILSTG